jgi:diguanylate cyclase (GGDEF)-like protein
MAGPLGARSSGRHLRSIDAIAQLPDTDIGSPARLGLGLIVRDLARALGAEIALLAVDDQARENVEVLATWGAAASPDDLPPSLLADGFVGRALGFERAAVEPIDTVHSGLEAAATKAGVRYAVGAPVEPLDGPSAVLCAAFQPDPSRDFAEMLWLAESYARLAALCLQDHEAIETLLSDAHLDGLTGCVTQANLLRELRREIARSDRHQLPVSCAFIDLDHFKRVNDRYGHLHGSRVLASIGAVLRAGIRSEDTIGRYGGDEFVLLLPNTDETAAGELAERLRSEIATTAINLPHEPVDASIGVAQWQPGSPADALLAAADEGLLAAKAAGGSRVIAASALTPPNALASLAPSASSADNGAITPTSRDVSMRAVLEVVAHFDQSGGASIELAAWELNADQARVADQWSEALIRGLITRCGTDPGTGEDMWRLSDQGRRASESDALPLS